jgi:hypothetical protein
LLEASAEALSARKKVQEENNPALPPSFDAVDENPGGILAQSSSVGGIWGYIPCRTLSDLTDFDR